MFKELERETDERMEEREKRRMLIRVSYRGGGALGYPPPKVQFSPPPRISYHNVIMNQIENCTSINAYRLMRLFFCLNMSKMGTEVSSTPRVKGR